MEITTRKPESPKTLTIEEEMEAVYSSLPSTAASVPDLPEPGRDEKVIDLADRRGGDSGSEDTGPVRPSEEFKGYSPGFQRQILALMFTDPSFLEMVSGILRPEYFDSKIDAIFAEIMLSFVKKFPGDEISKEVIYEEVRKLKIKKKIHDVEMPDYVKAFTEIAKPPKSGGYVKSEIRDFCRGKAIELELVNCVDLLEKKKFDEIRKRIDSVYEKISDDDIPACLSTEDHKKSKRFPDVMKGAAGEFAKLYSSHLESPAHFFFMSFLTCLGSILTGKVTVDLETSPQPRLYTILLGESASDRKSTAINKTVDFFRDTLTEGFNVCYGVGSPEGLMMRFKEDDNLLLCFDEFKQFVSKTQIKASVLLPCVNTLFESNHYESWTKKAAIRLENSHLSVLAASTVQTYENTWSSQFTDIGFNNRLFIVPGSGERKHALPQTISDWKKGDIKKAVQQILRLAHSHLRLRVVPEAFKVYENWYMNLEDSVHTRRLDTYALRLMSLLAINELKTEIDVEVVQDAIAICNWQLEMRKLHDPVDADNEMAKMEEKIRRVLRSKGVLKERDLKTSTNAYRKGSWYFDKAVKNLMESGEVGFSSSKGYFIREK